MSEPKPFYLKCECGGKPIWNHYHECWYCMTCFNDIKTPDITERYASALGLAVEALSLIAGEQVYNKSDTAEAALKKIRGEE